MKLNWILHFLLGLQSMLLLDLYYVLIAIIHLIFSALKLKKTGVKSADLNDFNQYRFNAVACDVIL